MCNNVCISVQDHTSTGIEDEKSKLSAVAILLQPILWYENLGRHMISTRSRVIPRTSYALAIDARRKRARLGTLQETPEPNKKAAERRLHIAASEATGIRNIVRLSDFIAE